MSDPAQLPKGAPPALRSFVRCEVDEARLDLSDAAWLNGIPLISGATTTARAGSSPNSASITFDAEWTPAFDLEVSIVDGELVASVPGNVGVAANGPIKDWTDALNQTLKDNNKQLRDLRINGTALRLRKQPIPVATDDEPVVTPPPVIEVPEPTEEPEKEPSGSNWGCLTGIVAAVTAILVTIGVVATSGGDDSATPADSVATETVITDDPAPATTPAPATSSPPPTTSTTTTSTPVDEVGQGGGLDTAAALFCVLMVGSEEDSEGYGELEVPGGNCDPSPETDDEYSSCDAAALPCSQDQATALVVAGTTGIDHTSGVDDVVTGDPGQSTLEEFLAYHFPFSDVAVELRAAANCAGTTVTGASEVGADGTAIVAVPLNSFGMCSEREFQAVVDGQTSRWPQVDGYLVDSSEPDPVAPTGGKYAIDGANQLGLGWTDNVNTVHNVIGGRTAVDDECLWFFEPQNVEVLVRVLDGCPMNDHYWVFAAGLANVEFEMTVTDTVLGTTAIFANPLGGLAPPAADTSAFNTTDSLFDNSIFPCGYGFVAYTACAEGEPAMEAGAFVTVSAAFADLVPLVSDGTDRLHHADFSASGGPRYSAIQDGDAWTVTSSLGQTRTRALIRGNSITFAVPSDELPETGLAYQWSTEIDGNEHVQPVVRVMGLITTPEMTPIEADTDVDAETTDESAPPEADPASESETVDESESADDEANPPVEFLADFYTQLSASVSAGDLGFALDRLDPRVFEVYPDSCPAALESFADPELVIAFIEEGPVEAWTYEANEQVVEIPDAVAVTIQLTGRGQEATPSEAHVSVIDGEYHWFTFC